MNKWMIWGGFYHPTPIFGSTPIYCPSQILESTTQSSNLSTKNQGAHMSLCGEIHPRFFSNRGSMSVFKERNEKHGAPNRNGPRNPTSQTLSLVGIAITVSVTLKGFSYIFDPSEFLGIGWWIRCGGWVVAMGSELQRFTTPGSWFVVFVVFFKIRRVWKIRVCVFVL